MIQARAAAEVTIPPEVSAFAAEQGVSSYLPAVLELTQRIYPKATLTVEVEDDPDIPNDRSILIRAEEVDMSVADGLEARERLLYGLFDVCPAPLVHVFRVTARGHR